MVTHFAMMKVSRQGVERPVGKLGDCGRSPTHGHAGLILGLLWLYDVGAHFAIYSRLEVSD